MLKLRFLYFLPAIAWFILIYILLTLPAKDIPQDPFFELIYFDKWVHAGLFLVLVFLFCYPLRNRIFYSKSIYILIAVLAIVYGVAMEYVQEYFVTGRSFDYTDMIADSIGAISGYFIFRVIVKRKKVV